MSLYVVLDGPDGCGKSEQARRLVAALRAGGREVLHLREPGSTPVGEKLRELLLDPATGELAPITEALLFFAARAELVRREIAPARSRGAAVVVERCYLSTLVYQGCAPAHAAVAAELLAQLVAAAHGAELPDRVFVLDVDHDTATRRRGAQDPDRIEARDRSFHERVRAGYLELAAADPRIEVIDGRPAADAVHTVIRARIAALVDAEAR